MSGWMQASPVPPTPAVSPGQSTGVTDIYATLASPQAVAALVALVSALMVAIIGLISKRYIDNWLQRQSSEAAKELEAVRLEASVQIERLRSDLALSIARQEDELSYLQTARHRLYTDLSPLLFQLSESSLSGLRAVRSLAFSYRASETSLHSSLDESAARWRGATMYALLAPMALVTLMKQRLTFLDLSVDEHMRQRYLFIVQMRTDWISLLTAAQIVTQGDDDYSAEIDGELILEAAVECLIHPEPKDSATTPLGDYVQQYLTAGSAVRQKTSGFEAALFGKQGSLAEGAGWREMLLIAGSLTVLGEERLGSAGSESSVTRFLSIDDLNVKWTDDPVIQDQINRWIESARQVINLRLRRVAT